MHFYTADGEPRHFVEMTSRPGELRPTRTADAKKNNWVPSVTTILNVLNKPALINWKVDQHLRQAWELRNENLTIDEFFLEVKRLTELEMDKAPSAGTDLHDKLERFLLNALPQDDDDYWLCLRVLDKIKEHTCRDDWQPERRFAHPFGFAGMVDLSTEPSSKGGENVGWVIDYKTKQFASKFKPGKMAYPDHHRQLAAYREGLGMPLARCANVFICLENGEIDFHEHSEADLQKGWATFHDALSIWRRENFDSRFNQEDAA